MLIIWYPGSGKSVIGMVEKIGVYGVKKILKLDAGSGEKFILFLNEDLEEELTAHQVNEGDIISIMRQSDQMFDVIKIEVDLSKLQGESQRIGAVA